MKLTANTQLLLDAPAMSDPRRVVIVAHRNSDSPRARRWYNVHIAVAFPGQPLLPLCYAPDKQFVVGVKASRLSDWVKVRKAVSRLFRYPEVAGVFESPSHGKYMRLLASGGRR